MALSRKNWTLNSYTNDQWTDFVVEECTIASMVICNTSEDEAHVSMRLADASNNSLATIMSNKPVTANEAITVDIRSLNVIVGQKLQVQANVAGVEITASGVIG